MKIKIRNKIIFCIYSCLLIIFVLCSTVSAAFTGQDYYNYPTKLNKEDFYLLAYNHTFSNDNVVNYNIIGILRSSDYDLLGTNYGNYKYGLLSLVCNEYGIDYSKCFNTSDQSFDTYVDLFNEMAVGPVLTGSTAESYRNFVLEFNTVYQAVFIGNQQLGGYRHAYYMGIQINKYLSNIIKECFLEFLNNMVDNNLTTSKFDFDFELYNIKWEQSYLSFTDETLSFDSIDDGTTLLLDYTNIRYDNTLTIMNNTNALFSANDTLNYFKSHSPYDFLPTKFNNLMTNYFIYLIEIIGILALIPLGKLLLGGK